MKSRHESPRPTDTVQCALSPGFALLNPVNPGRTYATRKFNFDTITFDTPVKLIESVPRLSRADKDRIMGGNAARLLKIKR